MLNISSLSREGILVVSVMDEDLVASIQAIQDKIPRFNIWQEIQVIGRYLAFPSFWNIWWIVGIQNDFQNIYEVVDHVAETHNNVQDLALILWVFI